MAKRKAISKGVRFEVFKRDGFECQYCGAHPPGIILHIDHIRAVSDGGSNEIDNLVTACEPCNLGKGARPLSLVPMALKDKRNEVAEREAQIHGYQAVMDARRRRLDMEASVVCSIFEGNAAGRTLSPSSMVSVRKFLTDIGLHEVMEAMEVACSRKPGGTQATFKYFCGVCWNKARAL